MLPYWADALDKSTQIGRHIFYRLRSSLGDSRAFVQHYAGTEPEPRPPGAAVVLPPSEATEMLAGALISESLNGATKDVEKAAQPPAPPLAADLASGTLIVGGEAPATGPKRSKPAADCTSRSDGKQLSPLGKADLRAGSSAGGC